ncbi:hypothetical protein V6N12_018880 [Hibiscus sabdariffa]|uniref:RNase H type-1 domain-containing protein n=1 Tax=Hibiscus sabdariffa TaxID=183260 RepID=A0ABR2ATG0_9ROSI
MANVLSLILRIIRTSVLGSFGPGGIGGILGNHRVDILVEFSKSIGVCDPASTELIAIKEVISLFVNLRWKETNIVFESNCINVVSWLRNPLTSPTVFKELVDGCLSSCASINWSIQAVDRLCNLDADRLAKAGINRIADWVIIVQSK